MTVVDGQSRCLSGLRYRRAVIEEVTSRLVGLGIMTIAVYRKAVMVSETKMFFYSNTLLLLSRIIRD